MDDNYLELAIEEVYSVLKKKAPWPDSMRSAEDRIKFLDSLIKYFERLEDYEKCGYLAGMKDELENTIKGD